MIDLLSNINIFNEPHYKEIIDRSLKNQNKVIQFYLNSQVIYEAYQNPKIKEILLNGDYLIADGYSIVWAYKKIIKKKIEKVVFTYSYFNFLRKYLIENKTPIFFLGAGDTVIKKGINLEKKEFPGLNVVGYHHGYFDKENCSKKIIKLINSSSPDILIVGFGCPTAEKWIIANKEKINAKLIISVGGFFDFLAKTNNIAPRYLYNTGFEWVYRVIQEPKRLFKRYLYSNLYFIYALIKNRNKYDG